MAKTRKKDKDVTKWKKKKWFPILAPKVFNNQFLGETTSMDPEKVLGKALKVNLMNLTGEVRNQNVNIRLRIKDIKDGQANTEVIGYTLSPSFIKRVVRRKHTRVDELCTLKTKDNKELVLKPMIITRSKANRSEVSALRTTAVQELTKNASATNYDDFIKLMVHYRLQLDMRKRLSKIFPLKTFEVKKLNLKKMPKPIIADNLCNKCKTCVEICPMSVLVMSEEVVQVQNDECIGCRACEAQCNKRAIEIRE